jgi:uncharacterized protein (DUF952 family)
LVLLHITSQEDWNAAIQAGEYRAASLATEGFIHLSTGQQILTTANRFYLGQTGLLLLGIASEKLTHPVRFEPVPDHGTFPHLFGALNLDAVTGIWTFEPQIVGTFSLPEDLQHAE